VDDQGSLLPARERVGMARESSSARERFGGHAIAVRPDGEGKEQYARMSERVQNAPQDEAVVEKDTRTTVVAGVLFLQRSSSGCRFRTRRLPRGRIWRDQNVERPVAEEDSVTPGKLKRGGHNRRHPADKRTIDCG